MSSYFGEFFGTMIMIILGNGVVANVCLRRTKAEGGGWMVITAGWAFAVMVAIFCAMAAGAPQADINPALTLIKMLVGIYEPLPARITMLCQTAGAFLGALVSTDLSRVVATLFILAMGSVIAALSLFLREVYVAVSSVSR